MARPAIFLDRDGTIIVDKNYLSDPEGVELTAGTADALGRLRAAGYLLVVVSNQSGIGRGMFTADDAEKVNARLCALLADCGAKLDGMYYCPHAPDDECACRKPGTGMIENAQRDFDLDLARSWVVGDKAADVELGRRIGARTALVRTGKGAEVERAGTCAADIVADDLAAAANIILKNT